MRKLLEMNLDTPSAIAFDWFLSLVSIAIGVWIGSTLWIVVGCVGCVAAYFRPLTKMQKMARGIITRRAMRSSN